MHIKVERSGDRYAEPVIEPARVDELDLIAPVRSKTDQVIRNAKDTLVTITRFAGLRETAGRRYEVTWKKLCVVFSDPTEYPDTQSLPLVRFSTSPGNTRRAGTVPESMTAVVGDYDGEKVTVDEAVTRLKEAGLTALVYTTRHHRPDAPRWRVVAQLAAPVSCADYGGYVDLINGALGGILAAESWDTTRSYFYGKVKNVDYCFEQLVGLPIDIKAQQGVEWEAMGRPKASAKVKVTEAAMLVPDDDREFERTIVLDQVTNRTVHDLKFALDAIKSLADERSAWNKVFLAAVSFKDTEYESEVRSMIEEWSQKHSTKWGEKEDDASKWDREHARDITFRTIFQMADTMDEQRSLAKTEESWRALAKAAWHENASSVVGSNVVPYTEFTNAMEPPSYIWHRVLQKGCLYALTAKWGHGKTALMITVAMHVATGRQLGGHQVKRQRVLYLCGENPADVQLRTRAAALKFDMDLNELAGQIFFTRRPFALENEVDLKKFVQEASAYGPFGLAVIDTGPAHSSADEENGNREMHTLAMAMRKLMEPLGNPATVALMHPTKEATRENLQPRGGGAFSGSIDGELCAWQNDGLLEFFHRTKFRGPGFEKMQFSLKKIELPGMQDNFGEAVMTVLAVESENADQSPIRAKLLNGAAEIARRALVSALGDIRFSRELDPDFASEAANALRCQPPVVGVHINDWRGVAYNMSISEGDGEARKKAFMRSREKLVSVGIARCWKDIFWLPGGP